MLRLDDLHYSASIVDEDGDNSDVYRSNPNEFNGFGDEHGEPTVDEKIPECEQEYQQVYYSIPLENSEEQESYEVPVLRSSIVYGEAGGDTNHLYDSSATADRVKQAAQGTVNTLSSENGCKRSDCNVVAGTFCSMPQ